MMPMMMPGYNPYFQMMMVPPVNGHVNPQHAYMPMAPGGYPGMLGPPQGQFPNYTPGMCKFDQRLEMGPSILNLSRS